MRIFGRRDEADSDPDAERAGPVATYAAVLDGEHLWWHVDGHDRLVLRPLDGAADRPVAPEVVVTGDRFALTGLTADAYDVLAGDRPVRAPDLPDRSPARSPLTRDGGTGYDIALAGGRLRIVRRATTSAATLGGIEVRGGRIRLHVVLPPGVGTDVRLVLLDEQDHALQALPATVTAGQLSGSLGATDLPVGYLGVLRVAVDTADGRKRIRRSDTGLLDPNHAVLLPELPDVRRPDRVRARLRWSPDSLLALRVLDVEAEDPR